MGSQIAIVQSAEDEQEIVARLQQRHRFLALPRVLASREVHVAELGRCEAQAQIFFAAEDEQTMRDNIQEIVGRPGEFQLDRVKLRGLFIEWNRTGWIRENEAEAGRYYFNRSPSQRSSSRLMENTMRAIQTWIKRDYPLRSAEAPATYVGPHLTQEVRAGKARVVYADGSSVELVEND